MDGRADTQLGHPGAESVSLGLADDELMPRRLAARACGPRQAKGGQAREGCPVAAAEVPQPLESAVQPVKLCSKRRGLQLVEAGVAANCLRVA